MLDGQFEDDDDPSAAGGDPAGRVQHRPAADEQRPAPGCRSASSAAPTSSPPPRPPSAATCSPPTPPQLGLVTGTPDDIDWEDEIRLVVEERASFSPDALTGMEANLRFAGQETPETKVFGRLTAWQNWIFQRPNAAGPEGALRRYGTGKRADYDRKRV